MALATLTTACGPDPTFEAENPFGAAFDTELEALGLDVTESSDYWYDELSTITRSGRLVVHDGRCEEPGEECVRDLLEDDSRIDYLSTEFGGWFQRVSFNVRSEADSTNSCTLVLKQTQSPRPTTMRAVTGSDWNFEMICDVP